MTFATAQGPERVGVSALPDIRPGSGQEQGAGTADEEAPGDGRPLRADARRNIERVLEAAEELFATDGLAVPVDLIAARAGVGVGTVYRHFPTKEALFRAVVIAHLEALVGRARELSACDPGEAFFTFVHELAALAARKRDLADALAGVEMHSHERYAVKDELKSAFDMLLQRAQAAGAVRADVTATDVTGLLMGTCLAAGCVNDGSPGPVMVTVICDGLRADGAHGTGGQH